MFECELHEIESVGSPWSAGAEWVGEGEAALARQVPKERARGSHPVTGPAKSDSASAEETAVTR